MKKVIYASAITVLFCSTCEYESFTMNRIKQQSTGSKTTELPREGQPLDPQVQQIIALKQELAQTRQEELALANKNTELFSQTQKQQEQIKALSRITRLFMQAAGFELTSGLLNKRDVQSIQEKLEGLLERNERLQAELAAKEQQLELANKGLQAQKAVMKSAIEAREKAEVQLKEAQEKLKQQEEEAQQKLQQQEQATQEAQRELEAQKRKAAAAAATTQPAPIPQRDSQ